MTEPNSDISDADTASPTPGLLRRQLTCRPWWMTLLMLFCGYMAFIYVPWDFLSKPVAEAQEVWFGYMLTGYAAKATEPLHLLIYLAGAIGFWQMKSWLHPWAALYALQVAIGMLVWNLLYDSGGGLFAGLLMCLPFLLLAGMLLRSRSRFGVQR